MRQVYNSSMPSVALFQARSEKPARRVSRTRHAAKAVAYSRGLLRNARDFAQLDHQPWIFRRVNMPLRLQRDIDRGCQAKVFILRLVTAGFAGAAAWFSVNRSEKDKLYAFIFIQI